LAERNMGRRIYSVMKRSIFNKANKLLPEVEFEGEAQNKAFLQVGDYGVTLSSDEKGTYIDTCTCKCCSILHATMLKQDRLILCSYKLAALTYMVNNKKQVLV